MTYRYVLYFFIAVAIGIALAVLNGCSYGTYNERGSYPNQENHQTDNCAKPQ